MLSICIAVKNRSRVIVDRHELLLLPNCVRSIAAASREEAKCELVVTDWASDDWPLEQWLGKAADTVPVQIVPAVGGFSRGLGLNAAAMAARGDVLFFTDADSLLCPEVVRRGVRYVSEGRAFFPVLYSYDGPEHGSGWWRHTGFGNCVVSREMWEKAGRWPEYRTWGKEDDHFHARVSSIAEVVREEVPGFYHQWHPDDVEWKDRYAVRTVEEQWELEQARLAKEELRQLAAQGETLILVDEARFGVDAIGTARALPFLEAGGEYAGPPADDEVAITELERLRREGKVRLVAFAWMAFWWLDYYARFCDHLVSRYECVFRNDRLVVFDVGKRTG